MKDDRSKTLSSGHFHNHIIGTPNYSLKVLELSVKKIARKNTLAFFVGVKAYTLVLSLKIIAKKQSLKVLLLIQSLKVYALTQSLKV